MKQDPKDPKHSFRFEDIPLVRLKKLKKRKTDIRTLARIRASIEEVGLLEPLHVCPDKDGDYGIMDGETRFDVLLEIGVETAPCIVFEVMDLYTANHQVNHLTPLEENRMIKKAMEVIDGQVIAKVFGIKSIDFRLNESLLSRLHPTVVKAYNAGKITKACARELAEVTSERQLEIFAVIGMNRRSCGLVSSPNPAVEKVPDSTRPRSRFEHCSRKPTTKAT